MDKRRMIGWMVAITVALLGLVLVQVYWTRSTLMLQEARFAGTVSNALFAVSERVERLEKMQDLQRHEIGRRLIVRLDTLRSQGRHGDPFNGVADPVNGLDPLGMASLAGEALDAEEQEAFVADMVRSILASELTRNMRTRLDPGLLDSLLAIELKEQGVDGGFRYGVFTATGEPVLLGNGSNDELEAMKRSPFRERLFRHDLTSQFHYLHVTVPGQKRLVLRSMLPMLLVSALFLIMIVFVFARAMRTIVHQKRLSDIRSDLVNNLTHELKTPISTIALACEALMDPSLPKTDAQMRMYTSMIRDENKRLGTLVENVLQSAVQDSGKMVLKPVQLDVHALIKDVMRSSGMQVSRRNGVIDLDLQAEIHHVSGDRTHLTNLLYNLIDNAVKYCNVEPRIRISTSSDHTGIRISVADNGIGIAPTEQGKIFDRLYRVPTGDIHNAKGFGLGLSYVRTVVERHGGRIRLESVPGKGSVFHIHIPFEHVPSAQVIVGRG